MFYPVFVCSCSELCLSVEVMFGVVCLSLR